ncbi:cytochrome P450 [Pholiota molesta]|nr:cytochrome P450 [Pholiota molesta]
MATFANLLYLSYYTLPLAGICVVMFYGVFLRWYSPLSRLPYPPGPPERSIIIGNAADMPASKSWLTYIELGKKYGNILHLRTYNQHHIILNSFEDCVELLERRSNTYSDRPKIAMINLMGWEFDAAFLPYGAEWRAHRRLYNQVFKAKASLNYRPIQTRKVHDFLFGLLKTPEDFMKHYRTLPGAIIMSTVYAHDVAPKNDLFVDLAEEAVGSLEHAVLPGAALVNALPILRFLPSWFPGAEFQHFCLEARKVLLRTRTLPLTSMEANMKEGKMSNCIAAELLENCKSEEERTRIIDVAATSYFVIYLLQTASSLGTFFCAMAMFPEVQAKAQRDIDLIIGSERLVNFDDMSSLPYIEALRREVMRWRPVAPLGLMRAASSDDVYKGYYIPKGATVVYNIWAIAHDPTRSLFNENGELNNDEVLFPFGFGRRLCPGRHLASATVWLAIATVLQNFDIEKQRDSTGNEIPISGEYGDGFLSHPLPFECSITPRSAKARQTILEVAERT